MTEYKVIDVQRKMLQVYSQEHKFLDIRGLITIERIIIDIAA